LYSRKCTDKIWLQSIETLPSHSPDILFFRKKEKCLIEHVSYTSFIGYGYYMQCFLDLAFEYAVKLGDKHQINLLSKDFDEKMARYPPWKTWESGRIKCVDFKDELCGDHILITIDKLYGALRYTRGNMEIISNIQQVNCWCCTSKTPPNVVNSQSALNIVLFYSWISEAQINFFSMFLVCGHCFIMK
jgi:hypothetical protein